MFITRYLSNPKKVGSIIPSSRSLSIHIANQAMALDGAYPLVEFGPGCGAITAFLPERTLSVEIDEGFVEILKTKYPKRRILHTDAADYLGKLHSPVNIVSSIPLIGNPCSNKIKDAIKVGAFAKIILIQQNQSLEISLATYTIFVVTIIIGQRARQFI